MRALVVDDDAEVAGYLATLLRQQGVEVECAADGEEAASWLRKVKFDLVFLDLELPRASGEFLLRLIRRGTLRRPGTLVLMSGAANLAKLDTEQDGLERVTLLPKPFSSSEVKAVVASSGRGELASAGRPVLLGGDGLWADALTRVVESRGARVTLVSTPFAFLQSFGRERPIAAVAGPPFGKRELVAVCGGLKGGPPEQERGALLIALPEADPALAGDLLTLGASRVMVLKGAIGRIADEVMRMAGLARRIHRRVPLVGPVLLRTGPAGAARHGMSFDLCEGGIGIDDLDDQVLPADRVSLEFNLPGDPEPVAAGAELAWIRNGSGTGTVQGGHRAGARFVDTAGPELARIRDYIAGYTPLPG